jgi:hypothetical protein
MTISVVVTAVGSANPGGAPGTWVGSNCEQTAPPKNATTYRADITVANATGPVTVTFRWTTTNGGDSDPSTKTLNFPAGTSTQSDTHNESFYLPDKTVTDLIWVIVFTPVSLQSNQAKYSLTCQPPIIIG